MKRLLLLCFSLIFHQKAVACYCARLKPLDAEKLQTYNYVALVKIQSLEPIHWDGSTAAQFTVDVIEAFKGQLPDKFLLDGYRSSCDIGLRPGQEWIIFTKEFKGYATVFACDYSSRYKDNAGIKDFRYHGTDELLNHIRHLTGKPVQVKEGLIEEYYPSGQKGYTEFYKNGKLEGERLVWHSNGVLWGNEFYKNGLKDGAATWWYADGNLESKDSYSNGVPIDSSWHWYEIETDSARLRMTSLLRNIPLDSVRQIYSRPQLMGFHIYGVGGQHLYMKSYHRDGIPNYEMILGTDITSLKYDILPGSDGNIQSIGMVNKHSGKPMYRLYFNKDGTQESSYYDAKGRLVRRTLIKAGIETIIEQKLYPY
ncbi:MULTISPECIES: hypothetical protein [unclassified Spirosoma]|uniref:hypothetical protein n=1 Tax=unclassified Spirosoma TaxID=2621999 RepID=UPI00095C7399|nr:MULTISPECIES: hypothetical protein [unclassified Spirosoma]MBN8822447.1 hypothetical protein [Spirosoma sp.]OJW73959.1 MAG: hypothetical protein BGO59_12505 [Spirosoma sp. 48-14]